MRLVLTTTLLALLLTAGSLLVYELRTNRSGWIEDLQTQSDLVASTTLPALMSGDARAAREALALLGLRPQIEAAALYEVSGRLFASYTAPGQPGLPETWAGAALSSHSFSNNQLELRRTLGPPQDPRGLMVVRARYDMFSRLVDYLAILGLVTLASLAMAALVARRLQSAITDPIVEVSDIARQVVLQRNYGLRARKTTHDEVGLLVDAFNNMLQELGAQSSALEAADRRKDEFLATLAHELRNPLAPISTALVVLQRGDSDAATQARLVTMMQRQMQQFVRLIDDLMEVSRISTGRLTLRVEVLDLVELVRSAVEGATPTLLERQHTLAVQWPDTVWIEGDRTRLGQVFSNLLANACKYTDRGGRIEVDFDVQPEAVTVHVRDNGIGIAPEMQAEIFEMFVQVDSTLERGRAGLGVGLSLARQLVALHRGRLGVDSPGLGRGARFSVLLPRHAGPPPAPPVATRALRSAGQSLHILLADDNRDFVDSLATVLVAEGHEVKVVYDGAAALQAMQTGAHEVGLFDIGMPELDGYRLASAVRALPQGDDCLLVALTGWGQDTDRRRAQQAGFDAHLVKPVDLNALNALLARHRTPA